MTNKPKPRERECLNCSRMIPGGWIKVDDIKNPHCSDCGRVILEQPTSRMIRTMEEWDIEFDFKFGGAFLNGDLGVEGENLMTDRGLKEGIKTSQIKVFISSLLSRREEEVRGER